MKNHVLVTLALTFGAMALAGCEPSTAESPSQKNVQSKKAQEAADSISFTENAEIENIKRRLEITSSPGSLGFIILLNDAGQPIIYEGVRGKVTSGGKRLTKPFSVNAGWDCGEWSCDKELPSPSDEGTWGSSSPYIFYWNTNGEYRQWSGAYLYSDKPFRLRIEPLVITATVETK